MTRSQHSAKNITYSILNYAVKIVLAFVVRSFFIKILSLDYLGVNTLFSNVLSLLSLAELGFGSAIVVMLYKPVQDGDVRKINSLINVFRKVYIIVGLIVLVVGCAIAPFLDFFFKDPPNVDVNLYIVYFLFLINSVVSYFMSYRFILFLAYQRLDAQYKIASLTTIISSAIQIGVLLFLGNYYIYLSATIAIGIISNLVTYLISIKTFPEIVTKNAEKLDPITRRELTSNVKGILYQKISYVVITSTGSLIISKMLGVTVLGIYSNYLMITTQLIAIFLLISESIRGSIGNLIAVGDRENSFKVFSELRLVFLWLSGFCTICLFVLFNPFIEIWAYISEWTEPEYTFGMSVVAVICVNFYIYTSRIITGTFREGIGLFYKDRFKGVAEAAINLGLSLLLAYYIGIAGVILGTVISSILTALWVDPYMLYKYHFERRMSEHLIVYGLHTLFTLIFAAVTYFVCSLLPNTSLWFFGIKLAICAVLPNVLYFLVYFKTKTFKGVAITTKSFAQKFVKRRKKAL